MHRDFIVQKGECFYRRETNQKGEMQERGESQLRRRYRERKRNRKERKGGDEKEQRKAEPSRRYIGIGVSHYKGVFYRIFKYSYSLPSAAIGVGEGGSTIEEAEIWVKTQHTMLFCCHLNDAATQRWILQRFHHKPELVFICFPFIRKPILFRKCQKPQKPYDF